MGDLVIIDYSTAEVWIYKLPSLHMEYSAIEDYIDSLGFKLSDIEWMARDYNIEIHDERK